MRTAIYIITFICFGIAVIFGGGYLYDLKIANFNNTLDVNTDSKIKPFKSKLASNKIISKTSNQTIIKMTPPLSLPGFDWSLPANTTISKNSGLVSEVGQNPSVVNNRFIMVRWDKSNPRQGQYDFSKLEAKLKRIAPQQALIRLEVNSSCEAPKWALDKLRETKHKSLIFWDKSYQDLTKPFIQNFAKRFAADPQILGVQLGLADGEFGTAADSCNDYGNKKGWGEFWMSPDERQEAESQFGFNPEVFTQATIANIDIYADAFGVNKNKLAFTNFGTLFSYGEGAEQYNQNLKDIAKYALGLGIGNRDGAVERWLTYTDKVYGNVFTTMPDGSCRLDVDEQYMQNLEGRYWGTENEFYGNKDYVIREMGPLENHPYRFLISSLRALQMRRKVMAITDMREINHVDYKTQAFLRYLTLTLGKTLDTTSDAFVLMGERYIAPSRLADQMDAACVNQQDKKVTVRSFGRWLTESSENTQIENKATMKIRMPADENFWFQGYYLPDGIDYEYFAREAKQFSFDLNDQLSQKRCNNNCEVEVKVTFKDRVKTRLHIQVAEGVSESLQTTGDNKIKTASFKIKSAFKNKLNGSDIRLISEEAAIPLILMRINLLK